MPFRACTVASRRDLPAARVLAASFLDHHPGAGFTTLLIDDRVPGEEPRSPGEIVRPTQLGIPEGELEELAMGFDEPALRAALTPWLLTFLLRRDGDPVLALAPAVQVLGRFGDFVDLTADHEVVLTARAERPPPRDERQPDEESWRAAGVVTPGVVAVGERGRGFVEWWRDQYRDPGREPPAHPLEMASALFAAHVLRDPAWQASWWNLHCGVLARGDTGYVMDGRPLRSFDFTGYAPERPGLLRDAPRPRLVLRDHPVLAQLCERYRADLLEAGYGGERPPYGYGVLPDGSPIDRRTRRLYREGLARAGRTDPGLPPNPFVEGGTEAFVAWLNEPVYPPLRPTLPRYLARLWRDDDDLRLRFPSPVGETAERYLEWVGAVGADERGVPPCVRPAPELLARVGGERSRGRPSLTPGVNLVGYLEAVSGIGEVGRLLVDALERAGVALAPVAAGETLSARDIRFPSVPPARAGHDINLLCVNAAQTPDVADQLGDEFFAGRRTVGLWFWEVDDFPVPAHRAIDVVDEIWVASEFTARAIAAATDTPVRTVPVPIPAGFPDVSAAFGRAELGLPDDNRHLFLYAFDYLSVPGRKNPRGVVEAFARAFSPGEGPVLVLKSVNGRERMAAMEDVRTAAEGRDDVLVIDEYWPEDRQGALLACCDTYVSLHRSEGYGLTMGEAMALAKPVIATGYSGNLEFMDADDAYLVEYSMRPVGPGHGPYPAAARWAEPDLDHAARLMRQVVEHPDEARARGQRAANRIRRRHSAEATASALREAIERVRALDPPATWRAYFTRGWRAEARPGTPRHYPYDWLPDGTPVDEIIQRVLGRREGPAPDPDAPGGSARLVAWLNEPAEPRRDGPVSRYLLEVWRGRPDLQRHFPDLTREPAAYLRWVLEHGDESEVPKEFVPGPEALARAERVSRARAGVPPGPRGLAYRAVRGPYRALRRLRRGTRGPPGKGGGPRHA